MDDVNVLAQGFLIGFVISAGSYGPLFFVFARQTLAHGRIVGFFSGLGIAAGDAIAAGIAVLGLALVSTLLDERQLWFRLTGGLIMCGVGLRLARLVPPDTVRTPTVATLAGAFGSTLGLTLATPSGIPYIAGLFATFGVPIGRGPLAAVLYLALGVFVGCAVLRFGQTLLLGAARGRLAPRMLRWSSLVAALVLLGAGLFAIATGVVEFTRRAA
jgi:threonine/homoserine/homoserine lactone efflux protein